MSIPSQPTTSNDSFGRLNNYHQRSSTHPSNHLHCCTIKFKGDTVSIIVKVEFAERGLGESVKVDCVAEKPT